MGKQLPRGEEAENAPVKVDWEGAQPLGFDT